MAKAILNVQRQSIPTVTDAYNNLLGITGITADSQFINISLSRLDEIDDQPFPINDGKVAQIAESIENVGVLEPLIVVQDNDRYKILSGRHRFRACKMLNKLEVPCYVKNVSNDIARYIILATNTDRNNEYKPSVYAKAYAEQKELMKKLGKKTVSSIAEKNEVSSKQIYRYIRLTYLIDEFMNWVDDEKIAFLTGVELSYLTDEQQYVILNFMSDRAMLEKTLTLETAQRLHKAVDNLNGDTEKFEYNIENIFYSKSDTIKAAGNEEDLTKNKTDKNDFEDDTKYEQENNSEYLPESNFSECDFEKKLSSEDESKAGKTDKKINIYKMHSDSYKQWIDKHPAESEETKKVINRKIKVFDFLAESDKEERFELFNSSVFNDVVRGYLIMAIDNIELSKEIESNLMRELTYLFDTIGAKQAEEYYNNR